MLVENKAISMGSDKSQAIASKEVTKTHCSLSMPEKE